MAAHVSIILPVTQYHVSITFPDSLVARPDSQGYYFNQVVACFEGHITDITAWDEQGRPGHLVFFTSVQQDLSVRLHNALCAGTIWSYSVRIASPDYDVHRRRYREAR